MMSLVLILPAARQSAGNALSQALGYGPDTYSVPLSPTGAEPATHFGAHVANASAAFVAALDAARAGNLPPGADPAVVQAVMGELIADPVETEDGRGHFDDVLAGHGLQRIEVAPTP